MSRTNFAHKSLFAPLALALFAGTALAGPLAPPAGPVASSMKTLAEVEPRIAISDVNTPGDADATPSMFKITQPGTYYLTGNIAGVAGKNGIEVAAFGVTVDLNGFSVTGVAGSLTGVFLVNGGTEVRNGTVRNWGVDGVGGATAVTSNRVIDVRAFGNLGVGIYAGNYSEVRNCVGSSNGSHGIAIYAFGRVEGCTARNNGGNGIDAPNSGNIVVNSSASQNAGNGITAFSSTVTGCIASDNTLSGISANYSMVSDCNVSGNDQWGIKLETGSTAIGNRVFGNTFGGFYAAASCSLENNTAISNGNSVAGRTGFTFNGSGNRAVNNHATGNPVGFHSSNGPNVLTGNTAIANTATGFLVSASTNTLLTGNNAAGNPANFTISAGNDSGAVITNPGVGFTTTNPAANFAN